MVETVRSADAELLLLLEIDESWSSKILYQTDGFGCRCMM